MSEAIQLPVLSPVDARALTDEVKQDAEKLWAKLVELHDGAAHLALGYSSWGAYFEAEFGQSPSRGKQLLRAGKVLDTLSQGTIVPPVNEGQARELAPLLDEPETLREAWAEVVEIHPQPTAAEVREVVQRRIVPPATPEDKERQLRWASTTNVLDALVHFDRDPVPEHAAREAALIEPEVAAKRGETITPARLRRASAWSALLADALERSNR